MRREEHDGARKSIACAKLSSPQRLLLVNTRERNGSGERWEEGKGVPRAPFFSLQRSRSRFFLWCLLTGASAEERGCGQKKPVGTIFGIGTAVKYCELKRCADPVRSTEPTTKMKS